MTQPTFPLIARRRIVGLPFGVLHSARRGWGSDVAGTRPYVPGDDMDTIHWGASARLSSTRDTDDFVVRMRYADEAPHVIVVADRRPEMTLFPRELPWLHKPAALRAATELIAASTARARGFVGYLDFAAGDEPFWQPPHRQSLQEVENRDRERSLFRSPEDGIARALEFLTSHRRSVPSGTFLFVLSDFLSPPPVDFWTRALELRWDAIPVVIQDPVWEQSFPRVESVVVPVADVDGQVRPVRLRRREAEARRREHEGRRERLLADFRRLGLQPVLVSSDEPDQVFHALFAWANERQFWRGRGW